MATTTVKVERPLRTRYEHVFFSAFAALIAVVVFVGFAQTYYLSGVLKLPAWKHALGPPHPWIVEIHGAIFTCWVLLLVLQSSLIGVGRADLHRKIGLVGSLLACLLVIAGVGVVCESIARHFHPGDPRVIFAASQALWIFGFAVLVSFAYVQRRNPRAHKRLMLMATIILLPAPLTRWPVLIAGNIRLAEACCYGLMVLIACYDLWSTRKIHPATLWGSTPFILTHQQVFQLFIHNPVWYQLASHLQALGLYLQ